MQGLVVAGAFLFISRSSPLETLSEERPHPTIFTPIVMLSMAGQFVVHMASLITVCSAAKQFERSKEELCVPPLIWSRQLLVVGLQLSAALYCRDPEADFKANVLNSSV